MSKFQVLLSALTLYTHNVHVMHWNVHGIDFDPVHAKLDDNYEMLNGFIDEVAELGVQVGVEPVGYFDVTNILDGDRDRTYMVIAGNEKFTSTEAFTRLGSMFSDLIELYEELTHEVLPGDVINKLQEHQGQLRKEYAYKNIRRLS